VRGWWWRGVGKLWLLTGSVGSVVGLTSQRVVDAVDAWLAWDLVDNRLDACHELLLIVDTKLRSRWRLWAAVHLSLSTKIHERELLSSEIGKLLLKELLTEREHALVCLKLSKQLRVFFDLVEVDIGRSHDLLRQMVELLSCLVLGRERRADGRVRNAIIRIATSVVVLLLGVARLVHAVDVLSLIVWRRRWDGRRLRLGAKTSEEIRAARAWWRRVINAILVERAELWR